MVTKCKGTWAGSGGRCVRKKTNPTQRMVPVRVPSSASARGRNTVASDWRCSGGSVGATAETAAARAAGSMAAGFGSAAVTDGVGWETLVGGLERSGMTAAARAPESCAVAAWATGGGVPGADVLSSESTIWRKAPLPPGASMTSCPSFAQILARTLRLVSCSRRIGLADRRSAAAHDDSAQRLEDLRAPPFPGRPRGAGGGRHDPRGPPRGPEPADGGETATLSRPGAARADPATRSDDRPRGPPASLQEAGGAPGGLPRGADRRDRRNPCGGSPASARGDLSRSGDASGHGAAGGGALPPGDARLPGHRGASGVRARALVLRKTGRGARLCRFPGGASVARGLHPGRRLQRIRRGGPGRRADPPGTTAP